MISLKEPTSLPGHGRWRLEVFRGGPAIQDALTRARLRDWQNLVEEAKQVAIYQAPEFVLTWYDVYAPEYEPLLLLGVAPGDRLVGVLPLAIPRGGPGGVVFAGAEHCEYTGWLATADMQEEFPAACVVRLHTLGLFRRDWDWNWLAPGTSLGWLDHPALRSRGIAGRVREGGTPILALQDPNRPRFFDPQGKNAKRKLKYLKRLGDVRLVRLSADTLTDQLFQQFMTAYDIRTLARFGSAPFTELPLKAVFHRRLLRQAPDAVCFYVLLAGSTPVAFHFGLADKLRVMYCLGAFDPRFLSASPGKLLNDLVADALHARGLDYLDHTPGGDPYKEEAASAHEAVHGVSLYPGPWRARARDVHSVLCRHGKRAVFAIGLTRTQFQDLGKALARTRGRPPWALAVAVLRALRKWACSWEVRVAYRVDRVAWERAHPPGPQDSLFRQDRLEDFLGYSGSDPWRSRQELMAEAIRRLGEGEHIYSVVEDGRLVHWAWLQMHVEEAEVSELAYRLRIPSRSGVAYDAYTEPRARGRGLQKRSLRHRVQQAFTMGAERVYSIASPSNAISCGNIERAGFQRDRRVLQLRVLGRTWKWEVVSRS